MNRTKTTIKYTSPQLTFRELQSGDMFIHYNDVYRVYIKMVPPSNTQSNCVVLSSPNVAGAHGYCCPNDKVTLVKEATFIV